MGVDAKTQKMEDGGDGGEREEMAWPPGDLQLAEEERPFEIERRFLIEEITKGVQQLVKNMSALNANMEALAQGGEEIAHFSHAFRRFYAQVAAAVPVAIAAASTSGSSALDDT